jgi:hypothetical protein
LKTFDEAGGRDRVLHDYPPDPLLDSRTQNLKRLLAKAEEQRKPSTQQAVWERLRSLVTAKESTST